MDINWRKIGLGVLAVDVALVNFGVGYALLKPAAKSTSSQSATTNQIPTETVASDSSSINQGLVDNLALLEKRIGVLENKQAATAASPVVEKTTTIVKTQPAAKTKSTQYVTIPGTGSTSQMNWTNIAGTEFYLDTTDYPGLLEVYFEAGVSLFNGNGRAYFRLFDATNGIGVQGSNIETTSQANSVVTSGKVSFWRGKNLIKVQAKSLTSDTAVFTWGRLKIVTEN